MQDWQYDVGILAWVNLKTGEASEENPIKSDARLSEADVEWARESYRLLPTTAKVMELYRFWPDADEERIKNNFLTIWPTSNTKDLDRVLGINKVSE